MTNNECKKSPCGIRKDKNHEWGGHQFRTKRANSEGILVKVTPYCYWCKIEREGEMDSPIPGDK